MKRLGFIIMIGIFLFNYLNGIQAQSIQLKPAMAVNQKLIRSINENWDETTNQWVKISKTEYAYDANGNNTLINGYNWNNNTARWVDDFRSVYTYDTHGNNTLLINNLWDEASGLSLIHISEPTRL